MKNVKFGVFCLGLAIAVVDRGLEPERAGTRSGRTGPGRANVMMLDGRGAELGVMVSDVDSKDDGGVKVDEVNRTAPAEKAGIKAGDVVVEFDGERVRSARQFTRLVQETPEGRSVAIAMHAGRQEADAECHAGDGADDVELRTGDRSRDARSRDAACANSVSTRRWTSISIPTIRRARRLRRIRMPGGCRMPSSASASGARTARRRRCSR